MRHPHPLPSSARHCREQAASHGVTGGGTLRRGTTRFPRTRPHGRPPSPPAGASRTFAAGASHKRSPTHRKTHNTQTQKYSITHGTPSHHKFCRRNIDSKRAPHIVRNTHERITHANASSTESVKNRRSTSSSEIVPYSTRASKLSTFATLRCHPTHTPTLPPTPNYTHTRAQRTFRQYSAPYSTMGVFLWKPLILPVWSNVSTSNSCASHVKRGGQR